MTIGEFKKIVSDNNLPDEMPIQLFKIESEDVRTIPINEVTTHSVENDDGEEIEILVIAF